MKRAYLSPRNILAGLKKLMMLLHFNPQFARISWIFMPNFIVFTKFGPMILKLPVKRLNRLSWSFAIVIGIIFYVIYANNGTKAYLYPFTLLSISGIVMVGYANVGIMIILYKWFSINSRTFNFYRFLFTYPAAILVYFIVWPLCAYLAKYPPPVWTVNMIMALVGSGIVMNTMVIMMHGSVILYENKLHSDLEMERLKVANIEAANLLLKQQIHPHFLFNALNTLKALYNKDVRVADNYIVHMANFLRASIYHQSSNVATLRDEVSLLSDYLEMQRIRFGSALQCNITLSEENMKQYSLPSFSLQPLLENAIKHNNFTRENPLYVIISQQGDWLVISNNIQKKTMKVASTNYGLANLAERYRIWSGDEIVIKEDQITFSVSIKLLKNEDSNY